MKKFRISWKEMHSVDVLVEDGDMALDQAIHNALKGSDAVSQKYQTVEEIELLESEIEAEK